MARKEDSNEVRRQMIERRQGTDRSPLHPQARHNRTASPAWEKKVSAEGGAAFAPSTPNRSRLSSATRTKSDDQEKGQALPKFGDWDAKDPSSADGFTVIFNKAREEKRGAGQRPLSPSKQNNELYKNPERSSSNKWYCCFGAAET